MGKHSQRGCIRCGTCCRKGGPVLHHQDKEIIRAGHAGYQHLITIRRGEMAFDPLSNGLRPAAQELVKVRGRGKEWCCAFFDAARSACTIYPHRFRECRLLKCWDPADLLAVVGKETLVRADLINPGDPILEMIALHERECSYEEVERLIAALSTPHHRDKALARLTTLVRRDLALRLYAERELGLCLDYELFVFGRPLFNYLEARGVPLPLVAPRVRGE
ncbi:YkgJ family cysteine cluster protein [Thermodesulfitimonas autotrophica]|uniref:YkgJ family cysteine cluster protein n=1 Tax=Thermodesulfitimonas autotrophica TaxID=1894989 RepID=UPI002FE3128B